jgi:CelD/BcsL family acetyltransferase involved in cellulose biosynthesis
MSLQVEPIRNHSDFARLEPEWNGLLRRSPSNGLFLTWEWVATWWSVYGPKDRLLVLVVRDDGGQLIGLAPLKVSRRRLFKVWPVEVLEFIGWGGDVTPEYLDMIVADGYHDAVVGELGRWLVASGEFDGIDLRPFRGDSPNLPPLTRALVGGGYIPVVSLDSVCPILNLPASAEAYLAGRSRNYRKKMGEFSRKCSRDLGAHVRTSETAEELERDMQRLVVLHGRRWGGRSRAFRTREYMRLHEAFSRRCLEQGWVRLMSLETTSGPVAFLYCFAYDARYYYYQAGRDPAFERYRVGLVLMDHAIRVAIGEGARVFDFLTGQEPYKYRWADSEAHSMRVVAWRTSALATVWRIRLALARAGRRMLGRSSKPGVRPPIGSSAS